MPNPLSPQVLVRRAHSLLFQISILCETAMDDLKDAYHQINPNEGDTTCAPEIQNQEINPSDSKTA